MSEAAFTTLCGIKFIDHLKISFNYGSNHHLRNAVAVIYGECLFAEICQDYFDFTAVIAVDCARRIQQSDIAFNC